MLLAGLSIALAGCGATSPDAVASRPGWQMPVRLGPAGGTSTWFANPSVAADAQGHAIAVWVETAGADYIQARVRAARFDPARQWSAPFTVGPARSDLRDHVVMNAAGDAAVAVSGPSVVLFSPDAGWVSLEMGGADQPIPAVALAEDGAAIAVWQADDPGSQDGFYERLRFWGAAVSPKGWGVPQLLSPAHAPNYRPFAIGVDGRGIATAVWVPSGPPQLFHEAAAVWTIRFVPGVGWGAPARLAELPNVTGDWADIEMAFDVHLDGHAVALWQGPGGLQASLYGPQGWSAPTIVGGEDIAHPRVRLLAGGRAVAAWESHGRGVEAVTFDEVRGWTPPRPVDGRPMPDAGYPGHDVGLGVDGSGRASVVWVQDGHIRAARFSAGGVWETPVSLQSTSKGADSPQLAISPGGQTFAVWAEQLEPGYRDGEEVWAAVYVPDLR
jgi:hypothetical protein